MSELEMAKKDATDQANYVEKLMKRGAPQSDIDAAKRDLTAYMNRLRRLMGAR